ncbi:hypothetical protein PC128_g26280 [Phytophthora cactorum]|nr:hypothetical protein PC120_g26878 [Phytophthora cactorum]KAG3036982.1 hypothetical protein PC121_g24163 [Phytophthora cactorum]KAG3133869.1 hypothetical protein PC128_g26280 [Phytophthora cactorum]KAG4037164.1 hypothetical protein PC123_g27269 [Phytophthora cactorum]
MLPTRRRTAITAAEKLEVLDAWVQCGNITAIIKAFYSGLDEFAQEQRRKLIYQCVHIVSSRSKLKEF